MTHPPSGPSTPPPPPGPKDRSLSARAWWWIAASELVLLLAMSVFVSAAFGPEVGMLPLLGLFLVTPWISPGRAA